MKMRKYLVFGLVVAATFLSSCTGGQAQLSNTSLAATEFSDKMKTLPNAPLIDVRTADEFSKGHLINARNYDWNGSGFDAQVATLDKEKPVFVYCLSGGRSSSAASKMRANGFKEVYELNGGIMKWRAANLPETTENAVVSAGMSGQQFRQILDTDKLVLVDFYADWCAPCKQMKPYLDDIAMNMADKVVVVRINADDNQALCKELKIDALPVLQLYKSKTLTWTNTGYIDKTGVVKQLK